MHTPIQKYSHALILCTALATLQACENRAATPSQPTVAVEADKAPSLRLSQEVRPIRYDLYLNLDPGKETFEGSVEIAANVQRSTSTLWLHATDLQVKEASITASQKTLPAKVHQEGNLVGLRLPSGIPVGDLVIKLSYQGKISSKDHRGIFTQKQEETYLFTHFEATDARRAFPCFDEPGFKTPMRLTMQVPKDLVALSNTPVASEKVEGSLREVRFAETKPLPTYLYAFAVGPFDLVDVGQVGARKIPVRIATPKGLSGQTHYAAQIIPPLFTRLEDYFGIPYPFDKLDIVTVPHFFGAMENPGLVTFAENFLLSKPESQSVEFEREMAGIMAHEIAHMWFGDLVTLSWWDDVWLNESFASWITAKIVDQWKPEWEDRIQQLRRTAAAMREDGLVSARRIRQPIESEHDIHNAFDAITYSKGEAVLAMFESWVGADTFQKGVQAYLKKFAYGSATAKDFLSSLSAAAGKDVAPILGTFLDQPGVPVVSVALRCEGTPRLQINQERYFPLGSDGDAKGSRWQFPVCIRFGSASGETQQCTLLSTKEASLPLSSGPAGQGCPDWLNANAGAGYYRVAYQGDLLQRLLGDGGKHLSVPERVSAISDMEAMLRQGTLKAAEALRLLPAILKAGEGNRHVLSASIVIVRGLEPLIPDELLPNYRTLIRKLYGERARAVGFFPRKAAESGDQRLLRAKLLGLVIEEGEDPVLAQEASKLARRWLTDRKAISPDLTDIVLRAAAKGGDAALYTRFLEEAKKTTEQRDRGQILESLGLFRDESVLRSALKLTLSDEFDARQSLDILMGAFHDRPSREIAYRFLKEHFVALSSRLPKDYAPFLLAIPGKVFCDESHKADVQDFALQRANAYPGGPRVAKKALERMGLCIAYGKAQKESVIQYLNQYLK